MPTFIVAGPFDVPLQPGVKSAKLIDRAAARSLAGQSDGFLRRGCYVFAVRAGKGARPIYVGMTKNHGRLPVLSTREAGSPQLPPPCSLTLSAASSLRPQNVCLRFQFPDSPPQSPRRSRHPVNCRAAGVPQYERRPTAACGWAPFMPGAKPAPGPHLDGGMPDKNPMWSLSYGITSPIDALIHIKRRLVVTATDRR